MNINPFAPSSEPPAIDHWRRSLLNLFLRLSLAMALPIVIISAINALFAGEFAILLLALGGYLTVVFAALLPKVAVQPRAQLIVLIGSLVGIALMAMNGILGAGSLLLMMTMTLAALLLPWQQALLLAALISASVVGLFVAFSVGWLATSTRVAASLAYPSVLLTNASNALFVVYVVWFLLAVLVSLIGRLSESLRATAATNAELERRVGDRTASLNEALRQLQLILRTIPEQFWLKDREGRYLLVSDALASYHGYTAEEMIGRSGAEVYDPDLAGYIAAGDALVYAGQNYYGERIVYDSTGQVRWFDSSRTPVYDEGGTLVGMVGLSRDITVRKVAEQALARQLRYAEALAQCSRIMLTRKIDADAYQHILAEALEVLRVATESDRVAVYHYPDWEQRLAHASLSMRLIGAVDAPHLPRQRPPTPEEIRDIPSQLSVILLQGKNFNGPVIGRFPNNPIFQQYQAESGIKSAVYQPIMVRGYLWGHMSVSDHGVERTWDEGALQLLRTAAEMIVTFTQGWEAGRALSDSEARLRALHDALPDLLFVVGDNGAIVSYHAPNDDQLYAPPEVFLGRPLTEVLPPALAQRMMAAIAETRRSGKMQIVEYDLAIADDLRVYEDRLLPINAIEVLSVVRDITDARRAADAMLRAKEAAEAADRAKSSFLATMSHEIRTPLNAVIGMAHLLDDSLLDAEQIGYVETIRTGGETLLAVISHILDFSRIESGQVDLELQPFDLRACIDDACKLVAYEAARRGLVFARQIAPDLPASVVGDVVRLRQVLINLLANAVKFTARGTVLLSASALPAPDGTYRVTLTVRDTGIGIAREQIAQIFEPFVQADSATTRRYGGTGLGLAICRQLVELMGGQISVESELSVGSTFTVTVPLGVVSPVAALPPAAPYAPAPLALRVLVVDDNPVNQIVTTRYLERLGHRVDVVENGVQAVEAAGRQPYDVVLMDVEMPELDGIQATRRIRELGDAIRQPSIIALTAHDVASERERLLRAGMDGFLSKPMQIDDLRRALSAAVARW